MNRQFLCALVTGMLLSLSGVARAQTTPETKSDEANTTHNITISEGTTARISLQSQLSSKISEVGDEVIGVLYESVRSSDGRVAIPRGTEFIGRVTQVQAAKRPQRQATITITFEQMRMSYGVEKVSTIVTAIDDYANDEKYKSKDEEGKVGGGHSGGRTGRNAGTMGGIGGAIGGAIGGLGGVLGGAGVGALGGVLMSKGNDIKLAPGTVLRVRFERPVSLPALETAREAPRNERQ
ncbi:MAG: hypothetical protein HYR56_13975 [Acidobacteria bacterium]|nr:hypothetical protein [Acidobacteriota bacterium]MBI3425255.1 hypothetical protein [Acidobacteriota bacterium]